MGATPEKSRTWALQDQAIAKVGERPTKEQIATLTDCEIIEISHNAYLNIEMIDTLHTSNEWSRLAEEARQWRKVAWLCDDELEHRGLGGIVA